MKPQCEMNRIKQSGWPGVVCLALLFAFSDKSALGQQATATVPIGSSPGAMAVNPVTNKIYVANHSSHDVTVIDGATNATASVSVGDSPLAVGVNTATNKIYVANYYSDNVTVIDGASNATTTVSTGTNPHAIAINPVTNKIYVANQTDVTVIDGASNATATVSAGTQPSRVAVNPVTNRIYVTSQISNDVTVIDGATNTTTSIAVDAPVFVAVNPVRHHCDRDRRGDQHCHAGERGQQSPIRGGESRYQQDLCHHPCQRSGNGHRWRHQCHHIGQCWKQSLRAGCRRRNQQDLRCQSGERRRHRD
jgi:YVTN family beta-propeller protein